MKKFNQLPIRVRAVLIALILAVLYVGWIVSWAISPITGFIVTIVVSSPILFYSLYRVVLGILEIRDLERELDNKSG
jgi:hypothetical protein